jgi:hypothetical protein
MTRTFRRTASLGAALVVACGVAATARADGLPVLGVNAGPGGVAAAAGDVRYVTLPAVGGTVVAQVERRDGLVPRSRFLHGTFVIPVVAYDGSSGGISADGRTLVLIRPRPAFPRARTTFAILDARRLRVRTLVTLRGDFSFDAISPDGGSVYLIQYVDPTDPTRYAVRAYDIRARRLLVAPVVDPHERGEAMRGFPITRQTSPDGRWAYTLYDGSGKAPFVHALDTGGRTAVCIDMDRLAGRRDLYNLRLAVTGDGRSLTVLSRQGPVAVVDTRTFRVGGPPPPATAESGSAWPLAGASSAAALLAAALALALRRRRRPARLAVERTV